MIRGILGWTCRGGGPCSALHFTRALSFGSGMENSRGRGRGAQSVPWNRQQPRGGSFGGRGASGHNAASLSGGVRPPASFSGPRNRDGRDGASSAGPRAQGPDELGAEQRERVAPAAPLFDDDDHFPTLAAASVAPRKSKRAEESRPAGLPSRPARPIPTDDRETAASAQGGRPSAAQDGQSPPVAAAASGSPRMSKNGEVSRPASLPSQPAQPSPTDQRETAASAQGGRPSAAQDGQSPPVAAAASGAPRPWKKIEESRPAGLPSQPAQAIRTDQRETAAPAQGGLPSAAHDGQFPPLPAAASGTPRMRKRAEESRPAGLPSQPAQPISTDQRETAASAQGGRSPAAQDGQGASNQGRKRDKRREMRTLDVQFGVRGAGDGDRSNSSGAHPRNKNPIEALGRTIARILRHEAVELNLKIRSDGYVAVEDLLKLSIKTMANRPLRDHSVEDVEQAVKQDNKQRFGLKDENGVLLIRANQGHSLKAVESDQLLKPVLSAAEVPVCVHGTYKRFMDAIKKEGLKRMSRNHVHFTTGKFGSANVVSGMRKTAEVFIFLDVEKALADNMKLYISENGVILTEGFDGVVRPEYFQKVTYA